MHLHTPPPASIHVDEESNLCIALHPHPESTHPAMALVELDCFGNPIPDWLTPELEPLENAFLFRIAEDGLYHMIGVGKDSGYRMILHVEHPNFWFAYRLNDRDALRVLARLSEGEDFDILFHEFIVLAKGSVVLTRKQS